LLAEGRKLALRIQFDDAQYPLEEFAFDGQRTYAGRYLHTVRSRLADFLERYNQILHEGLLGGVLSESWPPLALSERQPKLKYLGVKKVDDQSLLALDYKARGSGGLKITLYFDPGAYRHVLTTYSATVRIAMRSSREDNMAIHDAADRYTLEERFSDFHTVNGLDLPTRWNLRLIIDRATGVGFGDATSEWVWDITLDNIRHDQPIDPQAFVLE